jgi:hypothetical protein
MNEMMLQIYDRMAVFILSFRQIVLSFHVIYLKIKAAAGKNSKKKKSQE